MSAPISVSYADTLEDKKELEDQLTKLESDIQGYERSILIIQGEKKSLANEIKILDNTMAKINLQIKAVDLEIKRLGLRISDVNISIKDSEERIDSQRLLLTDSLKAVYESGQLSLLEILISRNSLSDFFSELNAQTSIQNQLQKELVLIRDLKENLEAIST